MAHDNDGLDDLFSNDTIKSMTREEYDGLVGRFDRLLDALGIPKYEPVTYKDMTRDQRFAWAVRQRLVSA